VSRRKRPDPPAPGTFQLRHPETAEALEFPARLPVMPLRDTVLFPRTTAPLFVHRPPSVAALDAAVAADKFVLLVAQREAETTRPQRRDLYQVGTVARVLQIFRLPDGSRRILIEGLATARLTALRRSGRIPRAEIELDLPPAAAASAPPRLLAAVKEAFAELVRRDRRLPQEALLGIQGVDDQLTLGWRLAAQLRTRVSVRQRLLECHDPIRRLRLIERILAAELEGLRLESAAGRAACADGGAAYGAAADAAEPPAQAAHPPEDDQEELARAIAAAGMPAVAAERARRELQRLARTAPVSPEAAVARTYLDWLVHLPWSAQTRDRTDLARVQRILDEDHHGLAEVKQRILELIAVVKLSREVRGPILCLAGPPGVGKTSLGRGIARALGRRFIRMSLGGVRDEAEIRGHRRTYVGSLPGRILQAMRRAEVVNPVILLDEIDKLGADYRGDPAAALLEVLDPEQNCAFSDHYLEVDYDLSRVLFVTTANALDAIPAPLRDRLEVIRIPGYLESEKLAIARRFLLPRQVAANGLQRRDLEIDDEGLLALIREYTREAGVRELERTIARICRRAATLKAGGAEPVLAALRSPRARRTLGLRLTREVLGDLLGVAPFAEQAYERQSRVGIATGLAWTAAGGEVLTVEVGVLPGRGELLLTGRLGDTLRESAQAALSFVRARAAQLGIDRRFYRRSDIHIHLPEGAVPKDGPSAGATIALALVSALTGIPTRSGVALSGEITLRGHLLAVGGLAEKALAARRIGAQRLLVPAANARHVAELAPEITAGLEIEFVATMDDVLALGLESLPVRGAARRNPPPEPLTLVPPAA